MNKIRENQNEINQQYIHDFELDDSDENNLVKIEQFLEKDNTNASIILTYLKLKKKLKKINLKREVEQYSYFLNKDIINKTFSLYYIKKNSSIDLFFSFYNKILKFTRGMSPQNRINYVENLVVIEDRSYIDYKMINNYVSYNNNKELYIYLLVNNIKESIKNQIKNFKFNKIDEKNDLIKNSKDKLKDY